MTARGEVLWTPRPDARSGTRIGDFLQWLERTRGLQFADYDQLWRWSVDDVGDFWWAFAEWCDTRWHDRPAVALADRQMPGAQWFPGATLNYAEHALAASGAQAEETAVLARSQTRADIELTWAQLADQVGRCRAGLERLGVRRGDRVAAYLPNIPEALVAFLATAGLGAVWSSCAPEFGVRAVVDRFGQIEPVVLLAIDGYRYGEKLVDRRDDVARIEAALPTLRHTVHVRYRGEGADDWTELLAEGAPPGFDPVPFDHPLYVLYSSGTTGLPKAIVHGHGGITLEHQKAIALHHGLGPGDRMLWFTTTGWMMWNTLMSGLLVGATVVLVDGDPASPDLGWLWRVAAETGTDAMGVGAALLMACRRDGVRPPPNRLRLLATTGAPLPPDGFRWIHDTLGASVRPASTSGGTDVCTGFVGGVELLPVRAGEITCRMLACAVTAFDPEGAECPPGMEGELVVTQPMPSMPVGFWDDPDGARLRATYFDRYPGVWRHGDWITFAADGSCVISGRSDATLNRGGVRLGTGDLYAVVESCPEIADSLVVHLEGGADDPMGTLALYVVLAPGVELDDDLVARLRAQLREELSPRHVPDLITAVPAIPRTLSGKKLEVPVKRILTGSRADDVASRSSLADPAALDWFEAHGAPPRSAGSTT